jgi:putative ABC transport system ATP-binding protein
MSSSNSILRVEDLWKSYQIGGENFHALKGISFQVQKGELLAIMGTSGSGKSTLMNILGCLDRPSKGKYYFNEIDTTSQSNIELARMRRGHFGFVFQAYNLLSRTSTYENVELPLLYTSRYTKAQRKEIVLDALNKVGLAQKIANKSNELSGGQQQRVAIARAIVNNPNIIFADEPTGNLDTRTSFEIMAIFQKLNEQGTTIVLVTHENDIANFASRKVVFKDGLIISDIKNEVPTRATEELKKLPIENLLGPTV